jgi:16S rRNA (adenine1518-N6/adenine1519-N6)-dimethyltransferase
METIPKKRYGQHFLKDTGILNRIVRLIQPQATDLIVEVGPGSGALSILLAPKVLRLISIEIDRDLIPELTRVLEPYPNTEIINQDFLATDVTAIAMPHLAPAVRLRIVGNLPYNVGTAIIEKLLSPQHPIADMTFMLQLETAERISAAPGSKEYGFFSVFCQHHCEVRMGFRVSPACFVPRPSVQSAMIVMLPRHASTEPETEALFLMITKAAFAYRRKKLANALRRHAQLGPATDMLLELAGIDGTRRAEELTVEEYEQLAQLYHKHCEGRFKATTPRS